MGHLRLPPDAPTGGDDQQPLRAVARRRLFMKIVFYRGRTSGHDQNPSKAGAAKGNARGREVSRRGALATAWMALNYGQRAQTTFAAVCCKIRPPPSLHHLYRSPVSETVEMSGEPPASGEFKEQQFRNAAARGRLGCWRAAYVNAWQGTMSISPPGLILSEPASGDPSANVYSPMATCSVISLLPVMVQWLADHRRPKIARRWSARRAHIVGQARPLCGSAPIRPKKRRTSQAP